MNKLLVVGLFGLLVVSAVMPVLSAGDTPSVAGNSLDVPLWAFHCICQDYGEVGQDCASWTVGEQATCRKYNSLYR